MHLPTALAKEICPVCAKAYDGPILIGKRLVKNEDNEVSKLHGQAIGFMENPCDDCQEMMKTAFVLIGIIEEKTEDRKNPYRSGHIWGIKKEKAEEMFREEVLHKGVAFIDIEMAKQLGLPVEE